MVEERTLAQTTLKTAQKLDSLSSKLIKLDDRIIRQNKPKNWHLVIGAGVVYGFKPLQANYGIQITFGRKILSL